MKFKFTKEKTDLKEMARVGKFEDFEILVWTNDSGNIPHFHVVDSNTKGDLFHTCVKITCAEYFHHTGKEDTFNSGDKKDLVTFLSKMSSSPRFSKFTNWEVLLTLWNMNNSKIEVDENQPMPNYLALK